MNWNYGDEIAFATNCIEISKKKAATLTQNCNNVEIWNRLTTERWKLNYALLKLQHKLSHNGKAGTPDKGQAKLCSGQSCQIKITLHHLNTIPENLQDVFQDYYKFNIEVGKISYYQQHITSTNYKQHKGFTLQITTTNSQCF